MHVLRRYSGVVLMVLTAALVARSLQPHIDQTNVVMVYMLAVVIVSFFLGVWPGIGTALLSLIVFDFVNLPPEFVFSLRIGEYWITLGVMTITAGTIAVLAERLRNEAAESRAREARAEALYDLSAELASAASRDHILETTCRHIGSAFHAQVECPAASPAEALPTDLVAVDERVAEPGLPATALRVVGPRLALDGARQRNHLRAMVRLATQALEREAMRRDMQATALRLQRESLRNSMLGSLSHDLRTPLSTIIGAASELLDAGDSHDAAGRRQLTRAILVDAVEMQRMVENLLDLARLRSSDGGIVVGWQAIEEIVGSAVSSLGRWYPQYHLRVAVPDDLPLIRCDGILIERVIVNLVENAVRHSPPDATITLAAGLSDGALELRVIDHGHGIPPDLRDVIFDAPIRQDRRDASGLGLTICRAIVDAHGGRIRAEETPGGGATFVVSLPLSATTPALDAEDAAREAP